MPASFSQRTLDALAEMKWSESRQGCAALMAPALRESGHVMSACAATFLDHFGYLRRLKQSPYQPGSVAFHTNAAEAGGQIHPSELTAYEEQVGSRLCPIGEAGYGFYVLLMDEHERVFAIDECGVMTKWADSGEELIEGLCTSCRMDPVDENDRWHSSGEDVRQIPPHEP